MLLPGAVPAPRAVLRDLIGLQVVSRVGQPGWAHLVGVDGRVHHHPGPAAQLRPGGQVHEHGPPVSPQRIDDQAARLRARTRRPIRGGRAGSSRLPLEVRIRDSQIRCPNESKKGGQRGEGNLEDALEEIPLSAGEAAPVGQHEQRQPFRVELLHRRRRLGRAVREPHLPRLRQRPTAARDEHLVDRHKIGSYGWS